MQISNKRKLKDLQKDFKNAFPYLKIEFYRSEHEFGEETPREDGLDAELSVAEARTLSTEGIMPLDGTQRTSEFEMDMAKKFDLNVQVFRKSYGKWLQTWATDNWSLQEQNDRSAKMGSKDL